MVDASAYHISRFTAEFTHPRVETEFREATHPARVRDTRIALAIAVLFYLVFTITDYLAVGMGEEYRLIFLTRLSLCGRLVRGLHLGARLDPHVHADLLDRKSVV